MRRWGVGAPGPADLPGGVRAASALGLFGVPDFRRLWFIGLALFAVRWLEMLVVAVFVYQRTGSAFDVALMTLLRMLPMVLFGPVIGAVAERWERRSAQIIAGVGLLLTDAVIVALAFAGRLEVWHLGMAAFCNGIAWAADNPVRRVMIGEVVGPERMGRAMAIDVGANNASQMLGPTVGGLVLAHFGIAGAFSISVTCYALSLIAACRLQHRNLAAPEAGTAVLTRLIEGLVMAGSDRRLIGILTITVIYNVFGWPVTSMIPVIGQDSLHLGATGIGVLASMTGVGAFIGAIAIAVWARPPHFTWLYVGAVLAYITLIIVFAQAPVPLAAGSALLATGLANSGFSVMQATLIYLAAPAEMRSRLYGVLSLCIGSGLIGFLHIGLLAEWIGAPWATTLSGLEGLLAMALTWRWWRLLLQRG
ncbi:MAG TPA: MFS transporter [Stellaceae bacterium]|nr:MFS transporter [Stellaceae bacterium]